MDPLSLSIAQPFLIPFQNRTFSASLWLWHACPCHRGPELQQTRWSAHWGPDCIAEFELGKYSLVGLEGKLPIDLRCTLSWPVALFNVVILFFGPLFYSLMLIIHAYCTLWYFSPGLQLSGLTQKSPYDGNKILWDFDCCQWITVLHRESTLFAPADDGWACNITQ